LDAFSLREPVPTSLENAFWQSRHGVFFRLPLEAMQRRAEIVAHGREVAGQCGTTAD
jgi:hypothetical protein